MNRLENKISRAFGFALLCCVLLRASLLHGEETGGSVYGVVVDTVTKGPVGKTEVRLILTSGVATDYLAITSADGHFEFLHVAPGSYRVAATRNGYLRGEYGQLRKDVPGIEIKISDNGEVRGVNVKLTPTGSIFGHVIDQNNQVAIGAKVEALRLSFENGQRNLKRVQETATNDLGEYRLFWLPPGQYVVRATISVVASYGSILVLNPNGTTRSVNTGVGSTYNFGSEMIAVPTFFPEAITDLKAGLINVTAGAATGTLDIHALLVHPRRIRGRVTDATGGPVAATLSLTSLLGTTAGVSKSTRSDADGRFEFDELIPQPYEVVATAASRKGNTTQTAMARSIVPLMDADIDGITLVLTPSHEIHGWVRMEDGPNDNRVGKNVSQILLSPLPLVAGAPSIRAAVNTDGTFLLRDVNQGTYRVMVFPIQNSRQSPPTSAYVASVQSSGKDLLMEGLHVDAADKTSLEMEIVIGADGGSLNGNVVDSSGSVSENATVVLAPARDVQRIDLYKSVVANREGHFEINGITPGEYLVLAWEDVEDGAWLDSSFLDLYRQRATRVQVGKGPGSTIEVAVVPAIP